MVPKCQPWLTSSGVCFGIAPAVLVKESMGCDPGWAAHWLPPVQQTRLAAATCVSQLTSFAGFYVLQVLNLEEGGAFTISSADTILEALVTK